MSGGTLAALMFPCLFGLIALGIPVSFSLLAVSFGFGYAFFGHLVGIQAFRFIYNVASTYVLTAIPLFIFMGAMLERSGIAERLYEAMRLWLGRLPGGMAMATIAMCAIFAAGTGIVGAVEALVGMMAIPAMMRYRYEHGLIAGTICAGGSLGTIIPPSILVVIYASAAQISVGKMFAGIVIPGVLMVVFFLLYIVVRCIIKPPVTGDSEQSEEPDVPLRRKLAITVTALVPALALVILVVGSILAGIASPTEASGVGALGTIILSALYRTLTLRTLLDAAKRTLLVNAMIMFIVVGGTMFTSIFRAQGGNELVSSLIDFLGLSSGGMIALFLFIVFLLGFVLDWVSIVLICTPIFLPLLESAHVDKLWFGIMTAVVIQTSYLTPPMAPSIFYLKAIAPPEMSYGSMYRGIIPFVFCQGVVLAIVIIFPAVATYLPNLLIGF